MKARPLEMHDEYEERYMRAADAFARSTTRMPWWTHAVFAALLAFTVFVMLHTHAWRSAVAALLSVATFGLWLVNLVVRLTATRRCVHVQHGLLGPEIPIEDIESVAVERVTVATWLNAVGWGVGGRGLDGSFAFLVPGRRDAIAIRYRLARGGARTVRISVDDPVGIASAIEAARARARIGEEPARIARSELAEAGAFGEESVDAFRRAPHR